jgi:hypothetical protein
VNRAQRRAAGQCRSPKASRPGLICLAMKWLATAPDTATAGTLILPSGEVAHSMPMIARAMFGPAPGRQP